MINKRLIGELKSSKKYIGWSVLFQWLRLLANVFAIFAMGHLLQNLYLKDFHTIPHTVGILLGSIVIQCICSLYASKMSYRASSLVKVTLREKIYRKLLKQGASYNEKVSTAEVVQVSVEGVEQLEIYFGKYLPQFFYSLLAPLTLFVILSFVNLKAAVILLICVPLIPISIIAVQKFAKKLLSKYWGIYVNLGDSFLDNLQGLTTLKIYQADEFKNQEMNEQAEQFRKITMKVLVMQLNSVTLMDLIAFGGAALGVITAATELAKGNVEFAGAFAIILLAAEFFIPLRLLGSFFHIAMNGMAASDKIFRILDLEDEPERTMSLKPQQLDVNLQHVRFAYEEQRPILRDVSMKFPQAGFTAIVGQSGSGKSTIASLVMNHNKGYEGQITVGGVELSDVTEASIHQHITLLTHRSYLFKGTVRDNLLMGNPHATEEQMLQAVQQVNLYGFLMAEQGLDTILEEKASNLSGGQRQRLAFARALLHDTPMYIFDEATSNIDAESENDIMAVVHELARKKTIVLISHRLANVVHADQIYMLQDGYVIEQGTHAELLVKQGEYARLYAHQMSLEQYGQGTTDKELVLHA